MNNLLRYAKAAACCCLFLLFGLTSPSRAWANVYATSILVNGSGQDITSPQGVLISISYILNEPASGGAEVQILSGNSVLRSISASAGEPGTLQGRNTITWDGKDNSGSLLPVGDYSLRVKVASTGFSGWTAISDDAGATNYVYRGTGIAVNRNPLSPAYGQVYVANSDSGPNAGIPGAKPGEELGLLRFNSDGSSGLVVSDPMWTGSGQSPWHIEVTQDDFVYANDLASAGALFRWTSDLADSSKTQILASDNLPETDDTLYGPAILAAGTNRSVWVGDFSSIQSKGILKYTLTSDGTVATGNTGVAVVGTTNDPSGLDQYPYDVALDNAGNVYTIQYRVAAGDLSPRLLRFPAYDPSTNNNLPEFIADWAIGAEDDTMGRASGVSVDPTGTYVAAAFKGIDGPSLDWINGCTQIFYASNGSLVTNLDLGLAVNGETTHQDTDCAWDAVGNVYFIDDFVQLWRVFSPPGANQSTTSGLQKIQVIPGGSGGESPVIRDIAYANGRVTIHFSATPGTAVSTIQLLGAPQANGVYAVIANAVITASSTPGEYTATAPASQSSLFYRIQVSGGGTSGQTPFITGLSYNGIAVQIDFTAATSDSPGDFTLLSTASLTAAFGPVTSAVFTSGSVPGSFRVTATASGPIQFYEIRR
jgi:hypothetical protein